MKHLQLSSPALSRAALSRQALSRQARRLGRCGLLVVAAAWAPASAVAGPATATAQPAAPAASAARSAPHVERQRRLLSPAQRRAQSETTPAPRLRIEGPVPPQIKLPLHARPQPHPGQQPGAHTEPGPPAPPQPAAVHTGPDPTRDAPAQAGAIDDAAARCDAKSDEPSRTLCHQQHETRLRARPPR